MFFFYPCPVCSLPCGICHDDKKKYFLCKNCGFIFLDPEQIVSSEIEKKRYQLHNNSMENPEYLKMLEAFISRNILPFKDPPSKLLDFGSGPEPVLASLLSKRGYSVDIYDKYFSANETYRNKKYDIITAVEVFEHLKNPVLWLKILLNCLDSKGFMIIQTNFLKNNTEFFKNWWYKEDITHISFFSLKTFRKISTILNLDIIFTNKQNIIFLSQKSE